MGMSKMKPQMLGIPGGFGVAYPSNPFEIARRKKTPKLGVPCDQKNHLRNSSFTPWICIHNWSVGIRRCLQGCQALPRVKLTENHGKPQCLDRVVSHMVVLYLKLFASTTLPRLYVPAITLVMAPSSAMAPPIFPACSRIFGSCLTIVIWC